MWLFVSRRIRTWLVLAVALPIVRAVIRRAAAYTARRYPDTPIASVLTHVEVLLSSFAGRRRRHR